MLVSTVVFHDIYLSSRTNAMKPAARQWHWKDHLNTLEMTVFISNLATFLKQASKLFVLVFCVFVTLLFWAFLHTCSCLWITFRLQHNSVLLLHRWWVPKLLFGRLGLDIRGVATSTCLLAWSLCDVGPSWSYFSSKSLALSMPITTLLSTVLEQDHC